jgi:hypothetical protein
MKRIIMDLMFQPPLYKTLAVTPIVSPLRSIGLCIYAQLACYNSA